MNIHRIVIATAGVVSFSLGWSAFAQTSPQSGTAPESQTTSQAPASPAEGQAPATPIVIIEVQKKLASEGYDPGAADGVWGPQTEAAVRNFQRDQNLDATGQLDQDTMEILLVPVDSNSSSEEAAGQGAQQGADTGAAEQSQGGSGATEESPQGGQQPQNRQ